MSIHKKTVANGCVYATEICLFCLTTEVYHISVVITMRNIEKGGVTLYKKFAELLVKTNKTAYQVSKDTGIAQSVLSDWKNNRSKPKADKLKVLADYFGVTVDYFLESSTQDSQSGLGRSVK